MEINEIVITGVAAIGLFLLLRAVWLWYFRINDMIKRQDRIIELLEKMAPQTDPEPENE